MNEYFLDNVHIFVAIRSIQIFKIHWKKLLKNPPKTLNSLPKGISIPY